jgi:hypothetical protein
MTDHVWDSATGYCTHCGILKGWHAEECLATPNVTGFMHRLAKRKWEREGKVMTWRGMLADVRLEGKIVVEPFPKDPA